MKKENERYWKILYRIPYTVYIISDDIISDDITSYRIISYYMM